MKTCLNCKHFHIYLGDFYTKFHIHDYCDAWKQVVPSDMQYVRVDEYNPLSEIGYSAVERKEAVCWMFEEKK